MNISEFCFVLTFSQKLDRKIRHLNNYIRNLTVKPEKNIFFLSLTVFQLSVPTPISRLLGDVLENWLETCFVASYWESTDQVLSLVKINEQLMTKLFFFKTACLFFLSGLSCKKSKSFYRILGYKRTFFLKLIKCVGIGKGSAWYTILSECLFT